MSLLAALYVETDGVYFEVPGVDPWDEKRDASYRSRHVSNAEAKSWAGAAHT